MAEAFVRTIKRDYARVNPLPDARTVIENLTFWFEHYLQRRSPAQRLALSFTARVHRRAIKPGGRVRFLG
jgi:hypothetical protein